ncbi:hypothetical protein FHR84_000527 [Actinopolyspora biskrensis]|uniref:Uncharacterized protein n=1 Tax=Actinopolyspora biskrensis TaxID=1470178 RepID=A0A852Z4N2_9ACTN|nr:hypothetical protein [Actinopolyspora biskrensis]
MPPDDRVITRRRFVPHGVEAADQASLAKQILEEFGKYAEIRPGDNESLTLSPRHLQLLASGQSPKRQPLDTIRPATAKLPESIFVLGYRQTIRIAFARENLGQTIDTC